MSASADTSRAEPRNDALDRMTDRVSDRVNPILVKELRQAMRGRLFRIAFGTMLFFLTVSTAGTLLSNQGLLEAGRLGGHIFEILYPFLGVALCGLVPFTAFASLGGEWEENTFDLLVLSNLRPSHLIRGRLLSALVQASLYVAVCAPFFACAFLLQGVDLLAMLFVIGGSLLWSLALSMLALALSSLARQRFMRVVLMVALGGGLAMGFAMSMQGGFEVLQSPEDLRRSTFWGEFLAAAIGIVYVACLLYCVACNQLSHPEENRSTNLRLTTSVAVVALPSILLFAITRSLSGPSDRASVLAAVFIVVAILVVAIPSIVFVSEPNRLGRRVAHWVPQHPGLAICLVPWLPGGGRGAMFYLLHLGFLSVAYPIVGLLFLDLEVSRMANEGLFAFYLLCLYLVSYLLIPSGLFGSRIKRTSTRIGIRVLIFVMPLLLMLIPTLLLFLSGVNGERVVQHPGNVGWVIVENWSDLDTPGTWVLVAAFAALSLLLNLSRMVRGFLEVQKLRSPSRASAPR